VPFGNVLASATGSWHAVFMIAVVMNLAAALAAAFVLKPMRAAHYARVGSTVAAPAQ